MSGDIRHISDTMPIQIRHREAYEVVQGAFRAAVGHAGHHLIVYKTDPTEARKKFEQIWKQILLGLRHRHGRQKVTETLEDMGYQEFDLPDFMDDLRALKSA